MPPVGSPALLIPGGGCGRRDSSGGAHQSSDVWETLGVGAFTPPKQGFLLKAHPRHSLIQGASFLCSETGRPLLRLQLPLPNGSASLRVLGCIDQTTGSPSSPGTLCLCQRSRARSPSAAHGGWWWRSSPELLPDPRLLTPHLLCSGACQEAEANLQSCGAPEARQGTPAMLVFIQLLLSQRFYP